MQDPYALIRMNTHHVTGTLEGRILATLESVRRDQGISIAELARRVGMDSKRLWYILNGQRAMRADELLKLCAYFDLGLGRFLSRSEVEELRRPEPLDCDAS